MRFTVQRARLDDINTIFRIRTSVSENGMTREQLAAIGVTIESVAEMLRADDVGAWLCLDKSEPVGFAMARAGEGDLFALFVLPEFQEHGVGSVLLRQSENWLIQRGVHHAWLVTGSSPGLRAQRFYSRRGWCVEGLEPDGQTRFSKKLR